MNKPKLLYVDDEVVNLMLFKAIFSKKYEVLIAENGILGLEILKENESICIVISDMNMPEMNGIEFITKATEKHPNISYYILTGYEITEDITKAIESKLILKCFGKPLNKNEIDDTLSKVIFK